MGDGGTRLPGLLMAHLSGSERNVLRGYRRWRDDRHDASGRPGRYSEHGDPRGRKSTPLLLPHARSPSLSRCNPRRISQRWRPPPFCSCADKFVPGARERAAWPGLRAASGRPMTHGSALYPPVYLQLLPRALYRRRPVAIESGTLLTAPRGPRGSTASSGRSSSPARVVRAQWPQVMARFHSSLEGPPGRTAEK